MPTIYAIGSSGMDYTVGGGSMIPFNHHYFDPTVIDVSSKVGAPLKQSSSVNLKSNSSNYRRTNGNGGNSPSQQNQLSNGGYNTRYKTQRCHSYSETGYCNYKEKCQFAHGDAELRQLPRHPKRKTELCKNFHLNGICNYGERCDFIHNESMAGNSTPSPPIVQHQQQQQSSPLSSLSSWSSDQSPLPWSNNQSPLPWMSTSSTSYDRNQSPLPWLNLNQSTPTQCCWTPSGNAVSPTMYSSDSETKHLFGGLGTELPKFGGLIN